MSQFPFDYPPGATPLDPNEVEGLIPDYITTQGELNALERENILEASNWAHGRQHSDSRHARMMTDILLSSGGQEAFSWGMRTFEGAFEVEGALRQEYISSLKKADQGDYDGLLRFVRS